MDFATTLPLFLTAYAILLVGALSPGPAVALLLGIATRQGRRAALVTTTGIALGSSTINLLTIVGVGLLLSQAAWAMLGLKLVGTIYLIWLAWGSFNKALRPPAVKVADGPRASAARLFLTGYLLQVTNPKAIAFWLAIAAVGATTNASAAVIATFVLGGFLISFVCHGAWSVLLSTQTVRSAYHSARRWVEGALGVLFTAFAFKLATSER